MDVWKRSFELGIAVYRASQSFPNDEAYGMRSQIRRAAISIPLNIAEGHERSTTKDFLRHLSIAQASLAETETLSFCSLSG